MQIPDVTIVVGATIALTQVIKMADREYKLDGWYPAIAVVLGFTISILTGHWWFEGLLTGLASTGLFKMGKDTLEKVTNR